MKQHQIAVIVGSLRKDSFNRKLADAIAKLAPPEFTFKQVSIGDLPLYNQDDDAQPAESVKRLKSYLLACAGPAVRDAGIQPLDAGRAEKRDRSRLVPTARARAGKPAGVLGASIGTIGTALAQQHLRNVLAYLDVPTMGQPEAFIHPSKTTCSTLRATSASAASPSSRTGWTATSPG